MHENLQRGEKIKGSSDRSFGLVIAVGFAVVALLPLWRYPHQPRWWALVPAIVFTLFALLRPQWLAMPNRLWLRFGLLLSSIVSPIVLALLFYTTIVPIGLLMRLSGKDPLRLRPDRVSGSYWIGRDSGGSSTSSIKQQF